MLEFIYVIKGKSGETSRELQESLGPSGPEIPKKSEKSLLGPPAPASQKVWKKSRKSPEQTPELQAKEFTQQCAY